MNKDLLFRFLGVAMMQKDLFLAMKRTSWLVIQWSYQVIIGFVLAMNIIYWKTESLAPDALWSTVKATEVVNVYMFTQLLLICLLFPFLAGSSITRERSEKTWSLLKTTALAPGELIRGKFFSLVCLGLYLLFLSAPLLVILTLLGGVNLSEVLFEYVFHICVIVWISAIGVLSSALTRKGAGAIISTPLFFFFPLLALVSLSGESYLQERQMVMSMAIDAFELTPVSFGVILSGIVISAIAALVGAIHLVSPVNSTRSLPTRLGIFALYLYGVACLYALHETEFSSDSMAHLGYSFFVTAALIPLLRIAGASPKVPLGIRQFARDHPFSSRALIPFTPGGIRNLLFCFLIILLFVPVGYMEFQTTVGQNFDSGRSDADYGYFQGLYFSSLFWVAAVMSFAWFLGQCGCSSILSASLAFTVHLIAVLLLTVISIRVDHYWSAFSVNISIISTPFNLFQTIAGPQARNFQRSFDAYSDGSLRMDTIFNVCQILIFSFMGCVLALRRKMALVSRFGEPEQGLLLDLPDVVEEVSGTRNDPEETALIGEKNEDSSQVQSEEQEK